MQTTFASPAVPQPRPVTPPQVVELSLEGPRPQRRATVAFRLLLAIPHLLYLFALSLAVAFALVIGWVAALVTGRLPTGIASFVANVVGYGTRVHGYAVLLLTDRYPAFSLVDDADYPISVRVPEGGRLNRLAVLFRLVLLVPVYFASAAVSSGLLAVSVFGWLVTCVAGRLPDTLFAADAVCLRYLSRCYSYALMLTSEFPRGLFGDRPQTDDVGPGVGGRGPGTLSWPSPEAGNQPGPEAGSPPVDAPLSAFPPPSAPALAPTSTPASPRITRLVLTKGAKRLVVAIIVIGAVLQVASTSKSVVQVASTTRAVRQLDAQHEALVTAEDTFASRSQACARQDAGVTCTRNAMAEMRQALTTYRAALQASTYPPNAVAYVEDLDATAEAMITSLAKLATLTDITSYQAEALRYQRLSTDLELRYLDLRRAVLGVRS